MVPDMACFILNSGDEIHTYILSVQLKSGQVKFFRLSFVFQWANAVIQTDIEGSLFI